VLGSLRSRCLGKLRQGRLLCPGSLYIVGQPDPLGVLKPDEVFICHGLPKGQHGTAIMRALQHPACGIRIDSYDTAHTI
jgi:hypothetical protein